MLNIHYLLPVTEAEGPGKRFCIWLQGCSRHCRGCMASDTWSFEVHQLYSVSRLLEILDQHPEVEGVTILGGEPLEQADELAAFLFKVRKRNLSVILFTGFRYEEIAESHNPDYEKILAYTDVILDGEFVLEKREFSRPLVGSSNQNYIFLTDRYSMRDFPKNQIEIRISPDGTIRMNGMWNFENLKKRFGGTEDDYQSEIPDCTCQFV